METSEPVTIFPVGIKFSNDKVDVYFMRSPEQGDEKKFANTPAGYNKLMRWVRKLLDKMGGDAAVHFCLEMEDAPCDALAMALAREDAPVSVVVAEAIQRYGEAAGVLGTDGQTDARLIADYCRTQAPALCRFNRPEVQELASVLREVEAVERILEKERASFQAARPTIPSVIESYERVAEIFERSLAGLDDGAVQLIEKHDGPGGLKEEKALLLSMPGVDERAAIRLLAQLPVLPPHE